MAELGRAALIVCLGLSLYALVVGSLAAWKGKRRLAASAQNALLAAFVAAAVATGVLLTALIRHDFSFVYAADFTSTKLPLALHDLGAVGRAGRIAAPLAARADGALEHGDPLQSLRGARGDRVGGAGAGARRIVLRAPPRRGRLAVRHADCAARGGRAQPEPPEPVHGRPPTDALSRLRRPDDPVRLRNGRAALRSHGRALDRRHAPLDARGMGVPRHRPAARALTGRTSRSAGAGTTPGIPSRTPR